MMKKRTLLIVVLTFVMVLALAMPAFAANNNIKVTVDGKQITFTDAKPYVDSHNRTQVPLRALGNAIGCQINWNEFGGSGGRDNWGRAILTKTSGDGTITVTNVYTTGYEGYYSEKTVNGIVVSEQDCYMDTVPILKANRIYLPARYVTKHFGYDINWNAQSNTISLTKSDNYIFD